MIEYPPEFISLADIERVRPWIEAALAYGYGTHDFADVIADVDANRATLWIFDKSAVVTQITDYPKIRILTFWLAGGNMRDMFSHEAGIVEWGKQHGCTRFSVLGRKGWGRAMVPMGYKPMHYITSKDVTP